MPFLHTLIKYAADRGGLAGRVADVGLRAMKKRCVAVLTAALCLMLVLGLQACAGSGGGRPIQDPQAGTVLPEGAKKEEGVVLDASDGQFILRAAGGGEYVFRMDGAEDMVEGGVQAGQYVRIWYDGVLTDTNARNVKLLRLAVGQLLRLFNKSATLENPIAVPEWVLGVFNVLLPAAGLAAAFWLLAVGVRATPMRLRISVQMPRDGRLWLFVPVFLGAGFLCSLLTTLLQRLLAAFTRYRAPEAIRLPQSGFATFLYFIGMCVVPAVLEELLVRGAMQAVLSRWGTWFSIVVSSVVFTLLHGDIAQMPSLFILSVLMGLAAYCTGSLALGMALHFAYNTMSFLFLYAAQKMDGVSAFAFAGYLVAVFCVGAVVCLAAIRRLGVMRRFRPIPRVYDPKNRQSRLERLASAPLFPLVMACMALRAAWPLFAK